MAKVRVRALKAGYDGHVRRSPGDEFDFDVERHGHGTWFEILDEGGNAPVREAKKPSKKVSKKASKKTRAKKSGDDERLA